MNSRPTFEERLHDWIDDGPTDAPHEVLDTVFAAIPSIPQRRDAWRLPWRTSPMIGFARLVAGLVIALGLGSAALFLVVRPGGIGDQASPAPGVVASASTGPSSAPPSPEPSLTPIPGAQLCRPADLIARISPWEGAAGHRITQVEITNAGSSPCNVQTMAKPQLVDGHGSVLIDGVAPGQSGTLLLGPGGTLKTLVQDGNYCGSAPAAPVSVAFVLSDGGSVVAIPSSTTDVTVPPCLGLPGSAGDIEMHPWAP